VGGRIETDDEEKHVEAWVGSHAHPAPNPYTHQVDLLQACGGRCQHSLKRLSHNMASPNFIPLFHSSSFCRGPVAVTTAGGLLY